jgi:septal ring factor EnvC (AmiA/AmiB activator)
MLYMAINAALAVALVVTTVFCAVMYRELRKFKALSGEYATILSETSQALVGVERAVAGVQEQGEATLVALGEKIDAARFTIEHLDKAQASLAAQVARLREQARAPQEQAEAARAEAGPRIRKSFEWPVVRGGLAVQDAS